MNLINNVKNWPDSCKRWRCIEAEAFIEQVADKGILNAAGIVTYGFEASKYTYYIQIIEGDYIKPFLMLRVCNKESNASSSDMIGQDFLNTQNIINLFRTLKNEIKD